ncbi:MAG: FAD-dependent oxidoreductase [Candidatus Methylacidiphilales bacterium]
MHDLLIIGAGPVGLALAIEAARYGLSFRLLEKRDSRSRYSKALGISASTQEAFASMGVAERFYQTGYHPKGVCFHDGKLELGRAVLSGMVDSPYPDLMILPQRETERLLEERLEELGGSVERGIELVGLDQQSGQVTARLRGSDGAEMTAQARWLVGCDGAHSTVRHLAGISFDGHPLPNTYVLGDIEVEGTLDPDFSHIFWGKLGFVIFFPISRTQWRITGNRAPSDERTDPPTLEELQALADDKSAGVRLLRPTWLSTFKIQERHAQQFQLGNIFLCGDAAHVHSPAGGQGMNTGIQDAFNLGWKLAWAKANPGAAEAVLGTYETERLPVAKEVLAAARARTERNQGAAGLEAILRDGIIMLLSHLTPFRKKQALDLSGLNFRYPVSTLVAEDEHWPLKLRPEGLAPGQLARDAALTLAGLDRSLFSEMVAGRFTWLIFRGHGAVDPFQQRITMLRELPSDWFQVVAVADDPAGLLGVYGDVAGRAHARYGAGDGAIYLVRPDHYIAARWRGLESDPTEWLQTIGEKESLAKN